MVPPPAINPTARLLVTLVVLACSTPPRVRPPAGLPKAPSVLI